MRDNKTFYRGELWVTNSMKAGRPKSFSVWFSDAFLLIMTKSKSNKKCSVTAQFYEGSLPYA